MDGTKGERFTHTFLLYHGGALPLRYEGKLFGVEPLQGRVVLSEITPDGSTFKTRDLERVVTSSDSWFRPVDIKAGPDGAIYIADWYDRQVTHTRNQEGYIDASNGRIYRLKKKGAKPIKPFDLSKSSKDQLFDLLRQDNQWIRQTTQRIIADRHDTTESVRFIDRLPTSKDSSPGLEGLWAMHGSGRFDERSAKTFLTNNYSPHYSPQMRLWTVRLLGDENRISRPIADAFADISAVETSLEVRAQLACTAKRLPAHDGLPIVKNLLAHDEDAKDPRQPLLCWWAIESKCDTDRDAVLALFESSPFWSQPMVERHLLDRLMRRFAAAGTRRDLLTCAKLLQLSPSREHSVKLMAGFEEAFKGRSLAGLPDELVAAMARHDVGSPAFRLRRGDPGTVADALKIIRDPKASAEQRLRFIEVLGEVKQSGAGRALLAVIESDKSGDPLRKAALTALLRYDDPSIGQEVAERFNSCSKDVRAAALTLLASRPTWSIALARRVEAGQIPPGDVPRDVVRQLQRHRDPDLTKLVARVWPQTSNPTTVEMAGQIKRLGDLIRSGQGDPYNGKKLFTATCGSCHTLFKQGGQIGPDLTAYQRGDLDAMLLNIVNPSAEIREGYESIVVETKDNRTLTGFIVEKDNRVLVLRGLDGQNILLDQGEIQDSTASGRSLMPDGLLDAFTDPQVRDLFAYLRSTQPLAN
jgi:putative heme-binding domain-containing protein